MIMYAHKAHTHILQLHINSSMVQIDGGTVRVLEEHGPHLRGMIAVNSEVPDSKEFFWKERSDGSLFAIVGEQSAVTSDDCRLAAADDAEGDSMCHLGGRTGHTHPCANPENCPGPVPSPMDVRMIVDASRHPALGFRSHTVTTFVGMYTLHGAEAHVSARQASRLASALADEADLMAELRPHECGWWWQDRMRDRGVWVTYTPHPDHELIAEATRHPRWGARASARRAHSQHPYFAKGVRLGRDAARRRRRAAV